MVRPQRDGQQPMFEACAQTPDAAAPPQTSVEAEPDTLSEAVQSDPALILDKIERWVDGFQRLIPNILVAIVVLLIFVGLGWMLQKGLLRWGKQSDRANLGEVMGSFVKRVVIILGLLVGLIVVLPTFRPGDLIAGLGIGSVAIGFAFKDILQNWLAGLLLLIRRPFRIGDEIVVNGYEGRVEWIETRATMIKTYDGRRAIIPNEADPDAERRSCASPSPGRVPCGHPERCWKSTPSRGEPIKKDSDKVVNVTVVKALKNSINA